PEETEGVIQTILNIVPTNPLEALAEGEILQIIFFAIFIGIGITVVGERAQHVQRFFDGFAEIMYKITNMIMTIVPLGIFGLLSPIVGEYGASVHLPRIKLSFALLIACLIPVVVLYSTAVKTLGKMHRSRFLKGIFLAASVSFSTSSSAGTLPVTLQDTQENCNVSKEASGFVLPLGATITMDGTSVYLGIED